MSESIPVTINEKSPIWAKNMQYIVIIIVALVVGLGVNLNGIINKTIENKVNIESAKLTQDAKIQTDSLTALIELNKEMSSHIVELMTNVNILILENQRLTKSNEDLNKTLLDINQAVFKLQEENQELQNKILELQKQIEDLQKQNNLLKESDIIN